MKPGYIIMALGLGMLLLGCQSQSVPTVSPSEHSLKGWQLYSWQEGGDWHFVLYPGTNALKKASEIKAAGDKATGVDNLKRELARMPRGEILFWSNGQMSDFTLPPGEIVVDVAQFCADHGIQLTMTLGG